MPILLLTLNLPTVKAFGEMEFWFAIIKVVAILALIIVGGYLIATTFTSPNGLCGRPGHHHVGQPLAHPRPGQEPLHRHVHPGRPGHRSRPGQPRGADLGRLQLHEASSFKMPGSTYMPYVVLTFFALMLVALSMDADTRLGLFVAPIWFILLAVAWHFNSKTPRQQARIAAWTAMADAEKLALTK